MKHYTLAPPRQTSTRTIYPRSHGSVEDGVYTKTSSVPLAPEAQELTRCEQLGIRTPHVVPANVLGFDREANVLETRFVSGISLFNILWNASSWLGFWRRASRLFPIVIASLVEIGEWLRAYHESTRQVAETQLAIDWTIDSYRKKIEVARKRRLLEPELLAAFERHTHEMARVLASGTPQELATIHGDFTCYNMLVNRDGVLHIMDFADSRQGLPMEDLAKFWHHLQMLASTSHRRERLLGSAAGAFLAGYGISEEVVESPGFQALRMYNVITHLNSTSTAWDHLGQGGRRAARRIDALALGWAKCRLHRLGLL